MKNILLVGANSATSLDLITNYENKYNFIKMSRNSKYSDIENFDLLDEKTYFNESIEIDGIVYFPGTINLKQFERLDVKDFEQDFNVNVIGDKEEEINSVSLRALDGTNLGIFNLINLCQLMDELINKKGRIE